MPLGTKRTYSMSDIRNLFIVLNPSAEIWLSHGSWYCIHKVADHTVYMKNDEQMEGGFKWCIQSLPQEGSTTTKSRCTSPHVCNESDASSSHTPEGLWEIRCFHLIQHGDVAASFIYMKGRTKHRQTYTWESAGVTLGKGFTAMVVLGTSLCLKQTNGSNLCFSTCNLWGGLVWKCMVCYAGGMERNCLSTLDTHLKQTWKLIKTKFKRFLDALIKLYNGATRYRVKFIFNRAKL